MVDIASIIKNNLDISKNSTLKYSVYEALKKSITLGEIPTGTRINELELSDKLNISRTPIRFAINELEKENLVEIIPRQGAKVLGVKTQDAYEIFAIRIALEKLINKFAMNNMTEKDLDDLKVILDNGSKYLEKGDSEKLEEAFSEFNQFIYDKSGLIRMQQIVKELKEYFKYFRNISATHDNRSRIAHEEHMKMYEVMKEKDEEELEKLTEIHLNRAYNFILEEMESRNLWK